MTHAKIFLKIRDFAHLTKKIDAFSIKILSKTLLFPQNWSHLRKNSRNHGNAQVFRRKLNFRQNSQFRQLEMVGTRDLLLMCSINPPKHYMVQFLERSSDGANGNTVLVEIEIHSMIWFHSRSSYTYILVKTTLTTRMQSNNIHNVQIACTALVSRTANARMQNSLLFSYIPLITSH